MARAKIKDSVMQKKILITGATDGIGLETAKMLYALGHHILLHGRNPAKLQNAKEALLLLPGEGRAQSYVADLSIMADVEAFARDVARDHKRLDVLINNAGIYMPGSITSDGLDIRFAVNTIAPYLLTKRLLPLLGENARVVNLSSAAQSSIDIQALLGRTSLSDGEAYAQSKLAITMWSRALALSLKEDGPVMVAVNPGSMLGSKMVKEAFGVAGGDISVGAKILTQAALSDEFADATGKYFDNDAEQFAPPHVDALDAAKSEEVMQAIEKVLAGSIR